MNVCKNAGWVANSVYTVSTGLSVRIRRISKIMWSNWPPPPHLPTPEIIRVRPWLLSPHLTCLKICLKIWTIKISKVANWKQETKNTQKTEKRRLGFIKSLPHPHPPPTPPPRFYKVPSSPAPHHPPPPQSRSLRLAFYCLLICLKITRWVDNNGGPDQAREFCNVWS